MNNTLEQAQAYGMYMLPTDLQPLARFKAIWPVSKPSLSTYVHVSALVTLGFSLKGLGFRQ